MKPSEASPKEVYPDPHHDTYSKTTFGFWLYLLTDFMLFGSIFASYAVLSQSTFGGPPGKEILSLNLAYAQTYLFLVGTFFVSLAGMFAHRRKAKATALSLILTFILGVVFLWLQMCEYQQLIESGNSWARSGYLSGLFTLLGTHTLHVILGLVWMLMLIISLFSNGINAMSLRRAACMKMFWQFLNIIWVFIFTIVYLVGFI